MAGNAITTASTLMCPHGGQVNIISTNARTQAGAFIARATDTFVIAGCPFTLPGPKPSPCVTVRWIVPDMRVTVSGGPTLSQGSTGLCLSPEQLPQGPVNVVATQARVSTQ